MTDLAALNQRFAIPDHVHFKQGPGELVFAEVANALAEATIALQGAHVMTFQPRGQAPVLWLSQFAKFAPGKSIRGGVPVCWPWFGPHEKEATFPAHGFARTVPWQILETAVTKEGATFLKFGLIETAATHAQWPHASSVEILVTVGATLHVEMITQNKGAESFVLGEALHTYFHVSDVADMAILGLEGCDYLDKVENFARKTQRGPIVIESEVDRVYLNTTADCVIEDRGLKRRIRIAKQGSHSTVVWNPWTEKADKMGDFGTQGHRNMVCVETANAMENVITIAPGTTHSLLALISTEPLN